MDSKIDTVGPDNVPAINEEMKMTGLEGRLDRIDIGIKTNRKAIFGLSCLCFVILITNINWYDIYHGKTDEVGFLFKMVAGIAIIAIVIILICKVACPGSTSSEDDFFKKQPGLLAKSV